MILCLCTAYFDIARAVKERVPDMHVHAFSPLEIHHGATSLNVPIKDYLKMLKDAGLGSLPGTAAEILDDAVRQEICPDKLNSEEWLSVVKSAHQVGIKTTSTIMFGHVDSETHVSWSKHLLALRELHRETNGITEFVPLPFVHFKAPIYEKGRARKGPTMRECVLMHAIGRLVLGPIGIKNIQASWPKMGPSFASNLLFAGCNDVGGVLMNESITRAAGSTFGQEFNVVEMEALTMIDMINKHVIPSVKKADVGNPNKLNDGIKQIKSALKKIHGEENETKQAQMARSLRLETMADVRKVCDDFEAKVPAEHWTLATYDELLFLDTLLI